MCASHLYLTSLRCRPLSIIGFLNHSTLCGRKQQVGWFEITLNSWKLYLIAQSTPAWIISHLFVGINLIMVNAVMESASCVSSQSGEYKLMIINQCCICGRKHSIDGVAPVGVETYATTWANWKINSVQYKSLTWATNFDSYFEFAPNTQHVVQRYHHTRRQ